MFRAMTHWAETYFEQVPLEEVRKNLGPGCPREAGMMSGEEFKYPWQTTLLDAVTEVDSKKLAEKTHKLEALIFERLQQLRQESDDGSERQALLDAQSTLRVLQRNNSNTPIGSETLRLGDG